MHRRGTERRRFVRVDEQVVASVERTGEQRHDVQTLNFSAGGVLLLHDEYVEAGTELRITLSLDDDGSLDFVARVVRVRSLSDHHHVVAAEFVGGSAGDHRRLQDVIGRHLTPPAPTPPPLTA